MIINHNLTSLSAMNRNKATNEMLRKSIKPLATGLKVNVSADDASGMSISEIMCSQVRGYDMAVRNAQDGLSMLRTAESSLSDTTEMLHRMRELTVQAVNDSLTLQDRKHIQDEVEELKLRITHIAEDTNFNTKNLLDGTSGALWSISNPTMRIRVKGGLVSVDSNGNEYNAEANYRIVIRSDGGKGHVRKSNVMSVSESTFETVTDEYGDDETIEVYHDKTLREMDNFYDSEGKFIVSEPQELTIVQGNGDMASVTLYGDDTLREVAVKINDAIATDLGHSSKAEDARHFATISDGTAMTPESVYTRSDVYDDEGNITGHEIKATLVVRSGVQGKEGELYFAGNDNLIKAFGLNTVQDSQEATYSVTITDAHSGDELVRGMKITGHVLNGVIHPNADIDFDPMAGAIAAWNEGERQYIMTSAGEYTADIHLMDNGVTFQTGAGHGESIKVRLSNASSRMIGVDRVSVMTRELAEKSLAYIDDAIDSIVKQRTQIVSYTNALENSIAQLSTASENLSHSRSRIVDADYADAAMTYISYKIVSDAGTAMIAQANQQPEAVYSLLGNR